MSRLDLDARIPQGKVWALAVVFWVMELFFTSRIYCICVVEFVEGWRDVENVLDIGMGW